MNSRQIEQIAVNAVKDIFLQSEIFNPLSMLKSKCFDHYF